MMDIDQSGNPQPEEIIEENIVEEKPIEKAKPPQPTKEYCYFRAFLAVLIIMIVWWVPTGFNIAITILAALIIILSASGCSCCKTKK